MTHMIGVEGLTKRFRRGGELVTAVDRATFELHAGGLTAIVGPSGSGKTTLINLLVRGDNPDEGRILGISEHPDWSELALVPQALGLLPELTLGENVDLPRRLGAKETTPSREIMERLGVLHLADRTPSEASLGEQQRAAIARALVTTSTLVVADEPTSHQDDTNARRVIEVLSEVSAAGSCVVVATHDERVIEAATHVLHIRDGLVRNA